MSLLPQSALPRRLEVGDRAPNLALRDIQGRPFTLDHPAHAGRVCVILYCASSIGTGVQRELTKLRDLQEKWLDLGVLVFAVTPLPVSENAALSAKLTLTFPILSDPSMSMGTAVGLETAAKGAGGKNKKTGACAVAVIDSNQRVEKLIEPAGDGRQVIRALTYLEKRRSRDTEAVIGQAPVLILPRVLDRDHCARLVRAFETGQTYQGGVASTEHGGNVPMQKIKSRQDVALADNGPEAQELFKIFQRRLFPEIKKAFNYRVTRAETLRLGCYTAEAGGHFVPHRDDTTPYTAHRRFAMSINLNVGEYDGGHLRFPEYGPNLYKADTGAAVVFSCSLLHEVTRITSGQRYVLLGFYYSEDGQAIREKLHSRDNSAGVSGS